MKKTKNSNKILIPFLIALVALIVLAVIIFMAAKSKKSPNAAEKIINLPVGAVKAQSYIAAKNPVLKDDDKIFGSRDASLKIFVYENAANLYSAELADTLDKIYSDNPDKLAIIVRPFVLKNSAIEEVSALAVECAGDQNKWKEMRALLFAKTKNEALISSEFASYGEQIGLDKELFSACLTNKDKSAKIEKLTEEAETYNVLGAPTIFIADEEILGARPYEDYVDSNGDKIEGLKTVIEKRLK
jgi:protein-disulfide isomerase